MRAVRISAEKAHQLDKSASLGEAFGLNLIGLSARLDTPRKIARDTWGRRVTSDTPFQ